MPGDRASCRRLALDLLARREHSRLELERKLTSRDHADALVGAVLDELEAEGLLADARFAAEFIRTRVTRGQGPLRIRAELRQRGVTDYEAALQSAGCDWVRLARAARVRRFGDETAESYREKARQARFLAQRGFTTEQIRDALEFADDSDS